MLGFLPVVSNQLTKTCFRFVVSDVTVLGSHGCLVGLFALTKHGQTSSAIKRLSLNKENLCLAEFSWWTRSPE